MGNLPPDLVALADQVMPEAAQDLDNMIQLVSTWRADGQDRAEIWLTLMHNFKRLGVTSVPVAGLAAEAILRIIEDREAVRRDGD